MSLKHIVIYSLICIVLSACASTALAPSAVTKDFTQLYASPSTTSPLLTVLKPRTHVNVLDCDNGIWCQISHKRLNGWAQSRYLSFKQATPVDVYSERRVLIGSPSFPFSPSPWPAFPRPYLNNYWVPSPFRPVFFR